jgi:hypothetical protein
MSGVGEDTQLRFDRLRGGSAASIGIRSDSHQRITIGPAQKTGLTRTI